MEEIRELAAYAAQHRLQGGSMKRNSLLKPLDIILEELERCPEPDNQNELALVRAGTKRMIFDYMDRIADVEYKPGRTKQEKINHYVDLFFDGVLNKAHHNNVNKLLGRERLIRSAYLFYLSEARSQLSKTSANGTTDEDTSLTTTV